MIYLDNNATTKMDDQVFNAMIPFLKEDYGNASSLHHKMGRKAHQAIEDSRQSIANFLGVQPQEIFFTSGATEAINLVLRGVFERYQSIGKHIITVKSEHKAVLSTLEYLTKKGAHITYLPLNDQGVIDPLELQRSIRQDTILVCTMLANNETGVIQPLEEISRITSENNILLFSDTTQAIGKLEFNVQQLGIDIGCFSAHKFHGPKGIGGLYIKKRSNRPIQIEAQITGGKQESSLRAGTYNTASIVGMRQAFEIIDFKNNTSIKQQRDYLEQKLIAEIPDSYIHASKAQRLDNTTNIVYKHVKSVQLMNRLHQVALSSGSACVSGDRDPSHVLLAMGVKAEDALCSIRFSLSKYNNQQEIDELIVQIKSAVAQLREQSPIWQMYKAGLIE